MRVGGGRDDEEVSRKLKSMDVDKLENGGGEESPHPPRPAVKYHGWKAMPFIIGACLRALPIALHPDPSLSLVSCARVWRLAMVATGETQIVLDCG